MDNNTNIQLVSNDEMLIYQSQDGIPKLDVQLHDETVWLSQKAMAQLFDCSVDNIALHLKNIFASGELNKDSVSEESSATAADGKVYNTRFYNLDDQLYQLESGN